MPSRDVNKPGKASTSQYKLGDQAIPAVALSDNPPADADKLVLAGWVITQALASKFNDVHAIIESSKVSINDI